MTFNYLYEKKKFDNTWDKLAKVYEEAGMSQKDIQEMQKYDWSVFKAKRVASHHSRGITVPDDFEGEVYPLVERSWENFTTHYDSLGGHTRYWWLEEIESPKLQANLTKLSDADKNLLTLYFVDGYTQAECADILHVSQCAIHKRLKKIYNTLAPK